MKCFLSTPIFITFDSVVGFFRLMVMSFLQLHDLLDADEHCVGTLYKIGEIFVGEFFCCGFLGGLNCPLLECTLLEFPLLFWMRSPWGFVKSLTCKARRVRGSITGPMGVSTLCFSRINEMSMAAEGVVVAPCCLILSGERLRLLAFAGGQPGVAWGLMGGWAGLCRHRMVQMSIAGISAREEQGLFTMCCGRCGLALILV